jgi:hypothetical protein
VISSSHYVPILLTKAGELQALRHAASAIKDRFTPLFAVPHVTWSYDTDDWAELLESHLGDLPGDLAQAWGPRRAFVDLLLVDDDTPMSDGRHPLEWFIGEAATWGLPLIPVVSPNRSGSYRAAAAAVQARDGRGVGLRLQVPEWPINTTPDGLDTLLTELGITPGDADVILDLAGQTGALALTVLRQQLTALPHLQEWRSLIVASGGMPEGMPTGAGIHVVARHDWDLYRQVRGSPVLLREPTFSDYAISSLVPVPDLDPKLMSLSATLRYTSGDTWLIAKGGLFKAPGGASQGGSAMQPVAMNLRAHAGYLGAQHCSCEKWLEGVVTGALSGGSPMVWRRHGTLHHLVAVGEQVATLHAASTAP